MVRLFQVWLWPICGQAAILLTGYNHWGNFTQNPSGEVAQALNGTVVEDLLVHSIRINVSEEGVLFAESRVRSGASDGSPWDAVVHLGFEDEAKGLKLETMAFNLRVSSTHPVVPEGPHLLPTTGDLGAVALKHTQPTRTLEPKCRELLLQRNLLPQPVLHSPAEAKAL